MDGRKDGRTEVKQYTPSPFGERGHKNAKKETKHIPEIVAALNTDIQMYMSALDRPSKTIERTESLDLSTTFGTIPSIQLLNITDEIEHEMQTVDENQRH